MNEISGLAFGNDAQPNSECRICFNPYATGLSGTLAYVSVRILKAPLKARPKRGALVRYGDRIAEVLGEARGERVMIRSLHADGVERRSAVKWKNLRLLDDQLI